MINHLFSFIFLFFMAFQGFSPFSIVDYDQYMNIWNKNITLAREYLMEAETALNNGDTLEACANQGKASEYGLIATKVRMSAAEIKDEKNIIPTLQDGLKRWKAFGDFCS